MGLPENLLARRVTAFYDSLDRMTELLSETIEEEETSLDDTQRLFDVIAPVMDEMRALVEAGAVGLPAEAERAAFGHYAYLTTGRPPWSEN